MNDIARNEMVQPVSMLNVGTRMMQWGFDQMEAAMGLQVKHLGRDRAVAQRACDTLLQVPPYNLGGFAQVWQTWMREYLAASVALWEQGLTSAARNQTAYGALLRDMVVGVEQAWLNAAPAQMAQPVAAVPQPANWMTYFDFGRFMGARPDDEAKPVKPQAHAASAG